MSYVTLETSMGPITIELYEQHAPQTCAKFKQLVQRGHYDGSHVSRIIPGFVVQAGATPTDTTPYTKDDISTTKLRHTGAGVIAMASPTSAQFYITLAPTPWLDDDSSTGAIFGRVSSGLRSVRRIAQVKTAHDDRPAEPITITGAKVDY
ncbi:hypothetical protein TRVA0_011S01662 [Trichomonascus vanleenenianus]|uniref:peptidylprolyl isomerase n=1 Tax=Trichomonascus vanleenenianus TaxID=2268995 RepID=UPI003EC9C783